MYRDWGTNMKCDLYADSSAALAIAKRKGAGKLRHINVSALWIQDVQDREGATYMKVLGTANPADLMTKYLTREKGRQRDRQDGSSGTGRQGELESRHPG